MKIADILCGLIAVAGIVIAVWQVMLYLSSAGGLAIESGTKHLIFAIVAGVFAIGSVVAYMMRNPRVEEEIHVTK